VIFATNWDAVFWNTAADELTRKVQLAWRQHAPHPNLPADLRSLLNATGFQVICQTPVAVINGAYHEDSLAYWMARLMVAFCVARSLLSGQEADAWLASLSAAQDAGRFFFSTTPVMTIGTATMR
jgi:hypothetical protein